MKRRAAAFWEQLKPIIVMLAIVTSLRSALAGVWTIESAEDRLGFATDLVRVDHAALILDGEFLDGLEPAQPATLIE